MVISLPRTRVQQHHHRPPTDQDHRHHRIENHQQNLAHESLARTLDLRNVVPEAQGPEQGHNHSRSESQSDNHQEETGHRQDQHETQDNPRDGQQSILKPFDSYDIQIGEQLLDLGFLVPDLFFATGVDEKGRATGIAKLCATFTMDESTSIGLFDPNSAARAFSEAKCCELFFLGLLGALSLMLYFIALLAVHRGAFAASPIVYQEYSSAIYHLATRVLWIFLKKLVAFKLLEFGLCFGIEEGVDWQRFVEGGWATFLEAVGCCKVAGLGGNIGKGAVLAELVGTFGDRVELLVGLLTDQAEVLDVRLIEWFVHGRLFRMIIWFITPCILLEYQILKQSQETTVSASRLKQILIASFQFDALCRC